MQTTGWFKYHRHNTGMEFIAIPYLTKKNKKTYMIIGKPQNNSKSITWLKLQNIKNCVCFISTNFNFGSMTTSEK